MFETRVRLVPARGGGYFVQRTSDGLWLLGGEKPYFGTIGLTPRFKTKANTQSDAQDEIGKMELYCHVTGIRIRHPRSKPQGKPVWAPM